MKYINKLIEDIESSVNGKCGTFVGLKLSSKSANEITNCIERNDIPNAIEKEKLHTTLIFSRKPLKNFTERGKLNKTITAKVKSVERLRGNESSTDALVLKLDAPSLVDRHKRIRKKYGATHDYDEYIPHVTVSYDIDDGDYDFLKDEIKEIEFNEEYSQPLDLDWK